MNTQVRNYIDSIEQKFESKISKEDGTIKMMLPHMNIVAGKENCELVKFENDMASTIKINLKTISAYDLVNFIRNQFK